MTHPADILDRFIDALDAVPGVRVEDGDGIRYAVKKLRTQYDSSRAQVGFSPGDMVYVSKPNYTYGGYHLYGTVGTVSEVEWNAVHQTWTVFVNIAGAMRWSEWEGAYTVDDKERTFAMSPDVLELQSKTGSPRIPHSDYQQAWHL